MATAFEHVTVIPMDRERTLVDQTVIVDGDRVRSVGPAADAKVPNGATRVDGRGKYLMPGLSDMHTHPSSEHDLLLSLRYGLTTLRVMAGFPRHKRWQERIAKGELLAPSLYTVSAVVDGRPPMRSGYLTIDTPEDAKSVVAAAKRAGYRDIKVYDQLRRDLWTSLVATVKAEGLRFVGHIPFLVGLDRALAAGQRSIEHSYGYMEGMHPKGSPLRECTLEPSKARQALADAITQPDDARIREMAEATAAAGTWNCPTMMIRRRHTQTLEELEARPEMRWADPLTLERWRQFTLTYPYDRRHKASELEIQHRLIKELHRLGAGVLAGTDSSVNWILFGAALHDELVDFVASGLSTYQTLEVATKTAARFLEQDKEWGTVEAGKRADLLLLDADPLADIRNTQRIAGVVARGRWSPVAELDRLLDASAAERRERQTRVDTTKTEGGGQRFYVRWGDLRLGREEVSVREDRTGRTLISEAKIAGYNAPGVQGGDAVYRSEVRYDASGKAVSGDLRSDTDDGSAHYRITRDGTLIRVEREDPSATERKSFELQENGIVGYSLTSTYIELARRVAGLVVGGHAEVGLLGPGVAPDFDVLVSNYAVERLADEGDRRRYSFVSTRENRAPISGLLICSQAGEAEEIHFGIRPSELSPNAKVQEKRPDAPPMIVQRQS